MVLPCDWQTTTQKIAHRGKYLLETGQWSDCKFIVGQEPHQQILEGHKVFLAMSSPVFEAMFYGTMAEKNEPIPIRDVQPEAFKALMEYIYTDQVNLGSFELVCELCYCAKKYMLPYLVEECTRFLWSDLSLKKACRAYEFAKLFEEPVLMEKCLHIICTKTDEVLMESSWDEVEQGTVLTLLNQEQLQISSETELFSALERWAKAECNRKSLDASDPKALKSVVGNALTKIRFLTLTPKEFADGPGKSPLLSQQEAFSILMNISSDKSIVPMPESFSSNTNSRSRMKVQDSCKLRLKHGSLTFPQSLYPSRPIRRMFSIPSSSSTETPPMVFLQDSSYEELLNNRYENRDAVSRVGVSTDAVPREVVANNRENNSQEVTNEILITSIRDRPKYYCVRPLMQQSDCRNYDMMDCSVTFTVDRNIFVLGVQVPSQILNVVDYHNMPGPYTAMNLINPDRTYTEVLYAHILDSDGARLDYTHYTTKVALRELIEISFNRPVYIQKNKRYTIGVVFNKPGWYPIGNCVQRLNCENVSFTFNVGANGVDYMRDGLMRSIVFTYR